MISARARLTRQQRPLSPAKTTRRVVRVDCLDEDEATLIRVDDPDAYLHLPRACLPEDLAPGQVLIVRITAERLHDAGTPS